MGFLLLISFECVACLAFGKIILLGALISTEHKLLKVNNYTLDGEFK